MVNIIEFIADCIWFLGGKNPNNPYDHYPGRRPVEQPNTIWVCEEYNAHFSVGKAWFLDEAKICIDEKWYDFELLWNILEPDVTMKIDFDGQPIEFFGYCGFGRKRCAFCIEDTKGLYPQQKIKMVFLRKKKKKK